MNKRNNRPFFKGGPITKASVLARVLGIEEKELLITAQRAELLYVPGKSAKKTDGSIRKTWKALPPLREIQKRIKNRLFTQIEFPPYLLGGIRDVTNPRSPQRNVEIHAGNPVLIKTDIRSFFPSINRDFVYAMWVGVCRYPADIAECLTKLTTKDGVVPQGASTSNHIANLILWDVEPRAHQKLATRGITYTRFIDDIHLSSTTRLTKIEIGNALATVIAMFGSKGFHPKREKQGVETSGHSMTIHNLKANRKPSLGRDKKRHLRTEVYNLEKEMRKGIVPENFFKRWQSASVKVGQAKRLHPKFALKLKDKLLQIRPARD